MPKKTRKKILIVGSGPVKIGEAAEFDYSTSQALRVLKEEGYESILVNSNVATVQTSYGMADKVYLLPANAEFVEKTIREERPWGIMIGFGGQSSLNAGVELYRSGVLERYNVKVLGTSVKDIETALSRDIFRKTMRAHGIQVPPSASARSKESAINAAKGIGYPVMLRVSFNLGGRGSAVLWNERQLVSELDRAFAQSSVGEVLIEKFLHGWKEIEYEVVRDKDANCAVTACIENLDPMGVHTGDSAVVTPAQTLDNHEFQAMRSVAIRVADAINLIGECNVQFALSPNSYEFYVIETNPRMSRSSALASKATGYPLAYVSAKLALGHRLYEIKNNVSKSTTAFFEPSLDYITVKMPRWDLHKFEFVDRSIGTEMKSIGEVMSIGRNFEEAMQKAIRMLDIREPGIVGGAVYNSAMGRKELIGILKEHRPYWFLHVAKGFREGVSLEEMHKLTNIDSFFLKKIEGIVRNYEKWRKGKASRGELKKLGFSDSQLGSGGGNGISIKQIDTLAGECPARTNYLYATNSGSEDDIDTKQERSKLLVLGAGVFRIGVSVEFDYGAVALAESAKRYFDEVAVLNYNPETVSTDWDRVDKLYFDELTEETVLNIHRKERFSNIATFAAGQIGNNLALSLEKKGIKLLGTNGRSIDMAENRDRFSALLEKLGIKQADWTSATSINDIRGFIEEFGFPVLVRPSYVLSGSSMKTANNMKELMMYIDAATRISPKYPVTVSHFIKEGVEAELDCGSDGRSAIGVSLYHVEEAGVHSGDATIATPYEDAYSNKRMKEIALRLVNELDIRGPFNLQFIIDRGEPHVIELNMRASRSMPFSSKSVGVNLIDYAVKGILERYDWNGFKEPTHGAFAVKSPQFSWGQLRGSYPLLGPEMRSTGESAAMGKSFGSALLKSWLGAQPNRIPRKGILVYGDTDKSILKETADMLSERITVNTLDLAPMHNHPTLDAEKVLEMMSGKSIDMVITNNGMQEIDYGIRRKAVDMNIPIVLNARLGRALGKSLFEKDLDCDELKSYWKK
ncbi:MAG: carbamoyl-phosphate synthase (glutamine-hydrolyzing) large subunit [Candidatus Micrarchaeota archaeon]|nr:carbamoyl-phosphate synthase (glutamine-hydrolyzing) large subunit [Candidatus Micrarchaeota archaeon]